MRVGKLLIKNMGFEFGCRSVVYVRNYANDRYCNISIPSDKMLIGADIISSIILMFQEVSDFVGTEEIVNLPTMVCDTTRPVDQIGTSSYFHVTRMASIAQLKAIGLSKIDFEYALMNCNREKTNV